MTKHCVFLKFPPETPATALQDCFRELAALAEKIPDLLDYSGGPNTSGEGLSRGYTHGFVMTFADAAARDAYLPHPDHLRVAERVVALTEGGVDGILVVDFET